MGSVERLSRQGGEPPQDQLRTPHPDTVRQAGQPPGAMSTRPAASPGSAACTPPRPATKGAAPAKPLPQGWQARASHPHTHVMAPTAGQARAAGPLGSWGRSRRDMLQGSRALGGTACQHHQGQAVEAAGQGEWRVTLGEPFNPSARPPPHLKDGGNTACPRGLL